MYRGTKTHIQRDQKIVINNVQLQPREQKTTNTNMIDHSTGLKNTLSPLPQEPTHQYQPKRKTAEHIYVFILDTS